jgi:serine/threonine-protein kinase RsbW
MDRTGAFRLELSDPWPEDAARVAAWVDAVEDRAVALAAAHGLEFEAARRLGLALREALVNALRHGRKADGSCAVTVRGRPTRTGVAVTVRDGGRGFDARRVPDPLLPTNLDKSSGRGIFCMRRLTDRVAFAFPRLGGTVVQLEARRARGAGRAPEEDPQRISQRLAAAS